MTGFPVLDKRVGGLKRGHFHQFSGRENSGKSTLSQNIIGHIQQYYPEVRFRIYDTEGNFDPEYAQACGISNHNLSIVVENDIVICLTDALEYLTNNNNEGVPSFILIDSYAGFTTVNEMDKGVGGFTRGEQVRKLNVFIRLAIIKLKQFGSVVLFTNQLRDDQNSQWGGVVTPGGHLLDHILNLHLRLYDHASNSKLIKTDGRIVGHPVAFTVAKGKSMSTFRGFSFNMDIIYGEGFSRVLNIIDMAIDTGVISQGGAWYQLPDGKKIQGRVKLYTELTTNVELLQQIYDLLE